MLLCLWLMKLTFWSWNSCGFDQWLLKQSPACICDFFKITFEWSSQSALGLCGNYDPSLVIWWFDGFNDNTSTTITYYLLNYFVPIYRLTKCNSGKILLYFFCCVFLKLYMDVINVSILSLKIAQNSTKKSKWYSSSDT